MKKRRNNAILAVTIIAVLGVLIWFFGTQQTIILISDNPNVIYHYAGALPLYKYDFPTWQYGPGRSNMCAHPQAFFDAGIVTSTVEDPNDAISKAVLPVTQVITIGETRYEFTIRNVRRASSATSTCGYLFYDAEVYRSGELIDSISFDTLQSCSDLSGTTITRDYGDVKATFAFRSESDGDTIYCGGRTSYIINRYEIKTGSLSCPAGTTFNAATNVCEATIACPPDTSYDATLKVCTYTPPVQTQCAEGFSYNAATDQCVLSSPASQCTAGTTYNTATGKCEAPVAPSDGTTVTADPSIPDVVTPSGPIGSTDSGQLVLFLLAGGALVLVIVFIVLLVRRRR